MEHMSSIRFRGIRVGLVSVFSCLLLLLCLFTFTGTASAQTVQTDPLFGCPHGQVLQTSRGKKRIFRFYCADPTSTTTDPLFGCPHGQVLQTSRGKKRIF